MEDQYIQILEKTNQQLSLWTNPYGIMVGALAVLFTILTIVAAIVVYRQSKEYKEKLQADRDQYAKSFNDFLVSQKSIIDQREKQAGEVEKKINELIEAYKKDLKESSATQKAEIGKAIKKLEEEKLSLSNTIGPLTVAPNSMGIGGISNIGIFNNTYHKCTKCGFGFFIDNNPTLTYLSFTRTVTCPRCGNTDKI